MKIQVVVRTVYGRVLIYPHNVEAQEFADLIRVKTFSMRELRILKRLGIQIEQIDGFTTLNIETALSQKVS